MSIRQQVSKWHSASICCCANGELSDPRLEMLSVLTKTFRIKAAIVLAVLYVLCILAPAVAFAFSDNPAVAHCLTEDHVGIHDHGSKHDGGKLHVHAHGSTHTH